jgi:hypothetical protein
MEQDQAVTPCATMTAEAEKLLNTHLPVQILNMHYTPRIAMAQHPSNPPGSLCPLCACLADLVIATSTHSFVNCLRFHAREILVENHYHGFYAFLRSPKEWSQCTVADLDALVEGLWGLKLLHLNVFVRLPNLDYILIPTFQKNVSLESVGVFAGATLHIELTQEVITLLAATIPQSCDNSTRVAHAVGWSTEEMGDADRQHDLHSDHFPAAEAIHPADGAAAAMPPPQAKRVMPRDDSSLDEPIAASGIAPPSMMLDEFEVQRDGRWASMPQAESVVFQASATTQQGMLQPRPQPRSVVGRGDGSSGTSVVIMSDCPPLHRTVRVSGVPLDIARHDLRSLLDQFGTVIRVRFREQDKRPHATETFVHVEFSSRTAAERMVNAGPITYAHYAMTAEIARHPIDLFDVFDAYPVANPRPDMDTVVKEHHKHFPVDVAVLSKPCRFGCRVARHADHLRHRKSDILTVTPTAAPSVRTEAIHVFPPVPPALSAPSWHPSGHIVNTLRTRADGTADTAEPQTPPAALRGMPTPQTVKHAVDDGGADMATMHLSLEGSVERRQRQRESELKGLLSAANGSHGHFREIYRSLRSHALAAAVQYAHNPNDANYNKAVVAADATLDYVLASKDDISADECTLIYGAVLEVVAMQIALSIRHANPAKEAVMLAYSCFRFPDAKTARPSATGKKKTGKVTIESFVMELSVDHVLTDAELNHAIQVILLVEDVDEEMAQTLFRKVMQLALGSKQNPRDCNVKTRVELMRIAKGPTLRQAVLPGVNDFVTAYLYGHTRVTVFSTDGEETSTLASPPSPLVSTPPTASVQHSDSFSETTHRRSGGHSAHRRTRSRR